MIYLNISIIVFLIYIIFLKKILSIQNNIHNLEYNFNKFVKYLKEETQYKECQFKNFSIKTGFSEFKKSDEHYDCNKIHKNMLFSFKNNTLKYKKSYFNGACKYRCIFPNGDKRIKYNKWKSIKNAKPDCDIFEVICKSLTTKEIIFYDIFLQFVKLNIIPNEKVNFLKSFYPIDKVKHNYNVHLIIIDSVSHFNALRGFSKTLKYLKDNYKGVIFKYLNKVGYGSKPNGFAFLLNKRIIDLQDFETDNFIPSDFDNSTDPCKQYLDNQPYIGKYYRQLNYTILFNEDSYESIFTMNDCKGFLKNIHHHTTRPFLHKLKLLQYDSKYKNSRFFKSKCFINPDYQLEYLKSFMEAYKNRRQFTITWLSKFSHDNLTGHYAYDNLFKTFFQNNKNLFNNGFLIFMGDHGFKMGLYRNTELGNYEDRNPFLLIAPPKKLRTSSSEVYKNLMFNSDKHISQFDVYATLFDIATEGSRNNFTNMKNFDFNNIVKNDIIKGLSLLRKITTSRNCLEMEITSQYCLCYNYHHNLNKKLLKKIKDKFINNGNIQFNINSVIRYIKNKFIKHLNNKIKLTKSKNICAKIKESKNGLFDMKYFVSKNNTLVFFIKQEVKPKGIYEAYFDEKGNLLNLAITRIDQYSKYIRKCNPSRKIENYCYCKNNK